MKIGDTRIFLVFGLGIVAMVTAVVIWQRAVQRWIESDRRESDSYEAVQKIKQIEAHLAAVESERHDRALSALSQDLRTMQQLADDDARQQARWEKLEELLSLRVAQLRSNAAPTKEHQEQLHTVLREIGEEESQRLHRHIEDKQKQMFTTVKEITGVLAGGALLFLFVFWLLRREIVARRQAEIRIAEEHAALERTMRELDESHWHLDKVAEYLPICMECGKVKTAGTRWEPLIEYFRKNELLLSHGLCPECDAKVRKNFTETRSDPKPT
jgi:CHASE3 domain sensor protein